MMRKSALYSFLALLALLGTMFGYLLFSVIFQSISILVVEIFLVTIFLVLTFFIVQLVFVLPKKKNASVEYSPVTNNSMTVVLTAYNDELSIQESVRDFINHDLVKRVIVVSNNSSDRTIEFAKSAGAITFNETQQGYGACVFRALTEGAKYEDTELTLLSEGDMTFRAYDIGKFIAYLPHADIVSGTRIVDQLRCGNTQLTNFMFYGNFFVGKLLELKHISHGTFTDVGTTYKLCRNEALHKLLPKLDHSINLQFNPYFLDTALSNQMKVVECPITFHPRVGESKGGNVNNFVAFKLGIKMMYGLIVKW